MEIKSKQFFKSLRSVIIEQTSQSAHEADATVWFGHYPTNTVVSPGLKEVMRSGLVYLCGHLHDLHGLASRMFVRHKARC